jgi:hypothetical protein
MERGQELWNSNMGKLRCALLRVAKAGIERGQSEKVGGRLYEIAPTAAAFERDNPHPWTTESTRLFWWVFSASSALARYRGSAGQGAVN